MAETVKTGTITGAARFISQPCHRGFFMAAPQLSIRKQNPPTRCEICHQADRFDPATNTCQRCLVVTTRGEIRLDQPLSFFQKLVIRTHLGADVPYPGVKKSRFTLIRNIVFALCYVLPLVSLVLFIGSNLLHNIRHRNHQNSIMQLRCLNSALVDFQREKGKGQFTNRLSDLEEFNNTDTNHKIDVKAQQIPNHGYLLGPIITKSASNREEAKYSITTYPSVKTSIFRTGDYSFFIDETGVIRFSCSPTALADEHSDPIN